MSRAQCLFRRIDRPARAYATRAYMTRAYAKGDAGPFLLRLVPALAAWLVLSGLGQAAFAQSRERASYTAISPIFSQLLRHSQPNRFQVAHQQTAGANYIRESIPAGETLQSWTEMITVTGHQGLADRPGLTAQAFAQQFAALFGRRCPQSFSSVVLPPAKIDERDAAVIVLSCGRAAGRPPQSETTMFVVIRGSTDIYTVQWAERGQASDTAIPIDKRRWLARYRQLGPIRLCPIEGAPFPNCMSRR